MKGNYCFADIPVEITSVHEAVHRMCGEYRTDAVPLAHIRTTEKDIAAERDYSKAQDRREGRTPGEFPDSYLETLAVYRKLAELMIGQDTLLMHGSAVAVDGQGYLFTAKSGTGKSTHTQLWKAYFGERAVIVNDDKPLVKITADGVRIYGTPWDGKHHRSCNLSVPLRAVCVLTRAAENQIVPLSRAETYPLLMQQTYRPQGAENTAKLLTLLDRLTRQTGLYRLGCNREITAAVTAYEGMRGEDI